MDVPALDEPASKAESSSSYAQTVRKTAGHTEWAAYGLKWSCGFGDLINRLGMSGICLRSCRRGDSSLF